MRYRSISSISLFVIFILLSMVAIVINPVNAGNQKILEKQTCIEISLIPGWNLISSPFAVKLDGLDKLYSYDVTGKYIKANELIPGKGYWLYSRSKEKETIKLCGVSEPVVLNIHKGYNLIGAGIGNVSAKEFSKLGIEKIWGYSGGRYYAPTSLSSGSGYFLYSDDEINIIIDDVYPYPILWCGDGHCTGPYENSTVCPADCPPENITEKFGWPQYKADSFRDSRTENYGPDNGNILWEINLTCHHASSPVVDKNENYVIINEYYSDPYDSYLSVFKAPSGDLAWSQFTGWYSLGWDAPIPTVPAVFRDKVYTSSDTGFFVFNLTDGSAVFSEITPSNSRPHLLLLPEEDWDSPNFPVPDSVAYGIGNNEVVLRRASNEAEIWRTGLINPSLPAEYREASRVVLLAGDEHRVYAVATHPAPAEFQKRWIYALNRTNGEILWVSRIPLKYYSAALVLDVVVSDEYVITTDNDGGVVAFNKETGDYAWSNILLGTSPYSLYGEYVPQAPLAVLDADVFAGKSFPARVGIFTSEDAYELHGEGHGLLQPAPTSDIPTGLEEYLPHCIAVSTSSNQIIVPFMSTSMDYINGTWVGDEDFNAVYSFDLDSAISGGTITSWNWRTSPFTWSQAITGCPAIDSKHIYAVTRGYPHFPVKLISMGA